MSISELHGWLVDCVDAGLAERDITQRQLAMEAGITQKHLSEIMNGYAVGSLAMWDRLLALVGVRDRALARLVGTDTDIPKDAPKETE